MIEVCRHFDVLFTVALHFDRPHFPVGCFSKLAFVVSKAIAPRFEAVGTDELGWKLCPSAYTSKVNVPDFGFVETGQEEGVNYGCLCAPSRYKFLDYRDVVV